jgi:hypothetical protein
MAAVRLSWRLLDWKVLVRLVDTTRSFIIGEVLWFSVVGDVICSGVMDNVIEFEW